MTTILIVDDDKFTRNVLATIFHQDKAFSEFGVEVVTAGDGEAGLEAFRKHSPEIVITDLLMPNVDGFDLCRAVRAEPGGDRVDLLVTSGVYRDPAVAQRLQTEFRAKFFAKPYQIKELTQDVAKRLARQKNQQLAGTVPPELPSLRKSAPPIPAPAPTAVPLPVPVAPSAAEPRAGALADTPLPCLLLDLLDARVTGRLVLERGRVQKVVELILGHPVAVTSNIREETLGYFLVARGVITDEVHQEALELAAQKHSRIGAALLEMGKLTSERLVELLLAQTRHKLVRSLTWPEGTWKFQPGMARPEAGVPLDAEHIVLHGLRQATTIDDAQKHAAALAGRRLVLTERGKRLWPRVARLLGERFAKGWSDGVTLEKLIEQENDRVEVLVAVHVLCQCAALCAVDAGAAGPTVGEGVKFQDKDGDLLSVAALSEHSQMRQRPLPARVDSGLYAVLFDDAGEIAGAGEEPLNEEDGPEAVPTRAAGRESGVIDVSEMGLDQLAGPEPDSEDTRARRRLLEEYLRIQDLDHYAVLRVERSASPADISAAVVERCAAFSLEYFARFNLGRDYAKLEELRHRYEFARAVLLDDRKRADYDQELAGGELGPSAPSIDAEIAYRGAGELLRRNDYAGAIRRLTRAMELAPGEPDYHASLGWACFLRDGRNAKAADAARPHLNQALRLNPDHARAHEYKGIITATLGDDEIEAISHLERALDVDPTRTEALTVLEGTWRRRGELRPLEHRYRRMIHQSTGKNPKAEAELWVKLAELYRDLDDTASARVAYESALRLSPEDQAIRDRLVRITRGDGAEGFYELSDGLRCRWSEDPMAAEPGRELLRMALRANLYDAAFMVASSMVARDVSDKDAQELYGQYRPRFLLRAQRTLDVELWQHVRHPDDSEEICALFDALAPVVTKVAPLRPDDLEIDEESAVPEPELPDSFRRVRAYVAHVLGVAVPRVYVRPDFGHQIHVGALDPPVLLAGDEALVAPERLELAFRLGRAMTYLRPSRALGGSRAGRVLKSAMLAVLASATPTRDVEDPSGIIAAFIAELRALDPAAQKQAHQRVLRVARSRRSINLSAWARSLARTADRVGLLLCGDLPAVVRFVRDASSEPIADLRDYAISQDHLIARDAMGLSVDV
jgi:CheY-like chemotaxis protein/tetratricopeptide (TPR) repeat protein